MTVNYYRPTPRRQPIYHPTLLERITLRTGMAIWTAMCCVFFALLLAAK